MERSSAASGSDTSEDGIAGNGVAVDNDSAAGNDEQDGNVSEKYVDPKTLGRGTDRPSEPVKNKGGRPKGYSPKTGRIDAGKTKPERAATVKQQAEKPVVDVDGLSFILLSIHEMASAAINAPEFKLKDEEAKLLSERACKVAAHYNFAPSEKVQDWCALIMVAGKMYYPRVLDMKTRLEMETQAKRAEAMGQQAGAVF